MLTALAVLVGCASGGGATDSANSKDSGTADLTCANAESLLLDDGSPSGFERCDDGAINRVSAETVDPSNPNESCLPSDSGTCTADAECADGANGRCTREQDWFGDMVCGCEYTCSTDADCAAGEACVPAEVRGGEVHPACAPAECRTGEDCPSGVCGLSDYFNGCGYFTALVCRSGADTCEGDRDCNPLRGETCAGATYDDPTAGFSCLDSTCSD